MRSTVQLRVIRDAPEPARGERQVAPAAPAAPDHGDLALLALLFLVNLVPVAGELTGLGRWSPSVVGFAACASLLSGRELSSQLRARARARTTGEGPP
jgi:hypothetical protein